VTGGGDNKEKTKKCRYTPLQSVAGFLVNNLLIF
jgi:hypothetical protein